MERAEFSQKFLFHFVYSHLHWNGRLYGKVLSRQQAWAAYCLGDGFGKCTPAELQAINDGWDWSHIRDSSDEGIKAIAAYIVAAKWAYKTVEVLIDKHLEMAAQLGLTPEQYLHWERTGEVLANHTIPAQLGD